MLSFTSSLSPNSDALAIFVTEKYDYKDKNGLLSKDLIQKITSSSIGDKCTSFSKMNIGETLPIIGACHHYIGHDTGWGHISSGLNLKSLFLFMDSPPLAYGVYSKNISIIVPEGESVESTKHKTRGKDLISFAEVLKKSIELIS